MRKLYFSPQKKNKKNDRIFSLVWNIVYYFRKSPCFEFFRDGKYDLFWAKKLMEIWYLLITEKFLFWNFREREIRSFLRQKVSGKMLFTDYWNVLFWTFRMESAVFFRQKVDGRMIFTGYWKLLILSFSVMVNTVFFEVKNWWKDDTYWLLKSYCFGLPKSSWFELFGDGKYGLF